MGFKGIGSVPAQLKYRLNNLLSKGIRSKYLLPVFSETRIIEACQSSFLGNHVLVVSLRYKIYLSFTVSVLNRPVDVCFTSFVRKTKNTLEKRVATE